MEKILIIGACSLDYIATSKEELIKEVSNTGTLSTSFGGVSRNVAQNLSMLGNEVNFITAIGKDNLGEQMKKHFEDIKVKVTYPKCKFPTSTYVAINNSNHDMALAIFDNRIVKEITPIFLESKKNFISNFDYIVMDANLSEESIAYICNTYYKDKKIFCESNSPQLVKRYLHFLDKIYLLKCNIHEAHSLINNFYLEKEELIKALFNLGLKNVVVSNNKFDIYYGLNNSEIYRFPIIPHDNFKNTTGCGDALFSGIIDALSHGKNFHEAIKFGNKLSNLTLMSDAANSLRVKKFAHKKLLKK